MEYGIDAPKHLDGMFSFVLYDKKLDRTIAARDPIGVTTFYQGWSSEQPGTTYFGSELKCMHPVCDKIESFPPGYVYDSQSDERTRYFQPTWWDPKRVPSTPLDLTLIRETLERSVRKRLMAEVPYGVLLSGGLDSSLVASIAQRETLRMRELVSASSEPTSFGAPEGDNADNMDIGEGLVGIDDDNKLSTVTYLPQLNSFSIGLPGSPDNKAALEVAKFLGTKHHVMTFTIEDGLNALSDVIYHLETYDVTTIRASTPMYLLSRKIKAMGIKMVLSGEGSDEIFGGYLYFHAAPDREAFHDETVRRIKNLHLADCLRANKSTSAWGLEARVPFLDKQFLEACMNIDPTEKMITKDRIEKYILRKAFDTSDDPTAQAYLPQNILWRQKEQFSDGVGYGWIDALKDNAELQVTDEMMKNPKPEWGDDIPDSKEAYVSSYSLPDPICLSVSLLLIIQATGIVLCSTSTSLRTAPRLSCGGRRHGLSRPTPAAGMYFCPLCYSLPFNDRVANQIFPVPLRLTTKSTMTLLPSRTAYFVALACAISRVYCPKICAASVGYWA